MREPAGSSGRQEPPAPGPPSRRAVALRYQPGERAPRVTASGTGLVAERILAAAREAGVPVRSDPALAEALAALELGGEVPEPLWRAVAETLAWAYRLELRSRPSGR